MSLPAELLELEKYYNKLNAEVEKAMLEAEPQIVLDNCMLDDCLKNQVLLQLEWEQFFARACGLEKEAESLREQYHSFAFVQAHSQSQRTLNSTDAKRYADVDSDYVAAVRIYSKSYKLRKEIEAVLSAVTTRKYALNNITNSVINGVEKHLL